MNIEGNIAIICITENGKKLALKINSLVNNCVIYQVKNKKSNLVVEETCVHTVQKKLSDFVGEIFSKFDYIVFIMATGIVVRSIAPYIISKFSDPAILVMDEKGKNVISLLSGHIGGANSLTQYISSLIEVDTRGFKLIESKDELRDSFSNTYIEKLVVVSNKINCIEDIENLNLDNKFEHCYSTKKIIKVIPRDIVIGIGCRRNTDSELMYNSLEEFLNKQNIDIRAINTVGSIELKKDEKAIIELSKILKVPFKTFSVDEISKVDNLFDKSDFVKKNVGVYSVAEPVAYLLSKGNLLVEKHKYKGITFSVGRIKI